MLSIHKKMMYLTMVACCLHTLFWTTSRESNSNAPYSSQHPLILHGKHPLTHLLIRSGHARLLHAGPKLLTASLNRRFHIVGHRKAIRSVTRGCITCRRTSVRPQPQMLGQLPMERVFGIDYAGTVYIKYGFVRKPTIAMYAFSCLYL